MSYLRDQWTLLRARRFQSDGLSSCDDRLGGWGRAQGAPRAAASRVAKSSGGTLRSTPATLCVVLMLLVGSVQAQQPTLGYVFPPAVRVGTTTEVQLGGYDFTPDLEFFVHHDDVKLTPLGTPSEFFVPPPPYWFGPKGFTTAFKLPREVAARIDVPAGAPTGLVHWQVANANGASATAVFYVSDGNEIIEDRFRDSATQRLPTLPIAVSGRIGKISEVDRYGFVADSDGPITVDLMARRLGADFNGVVEIHDSAGRLLADAADTAGADVALTFDSRAGETYTASLFDADFRGNQAFVYRLAVTPGPGIVATIPAVARRGETREIEVVGHGVANGKAAIKSHRQVVAFPTTGDHTVATTPVGSTSIRLSDVPQYLEPAARESGLTAPCAVTGTLEADSTVDRYSWSSMAGEQWRIDLRSRGLGTALDVSLDVEDATGKVVATNDDLPGTLDAGLDFRAPADGTYTCVIRDGSGLPTDRASIYHLTLRRQAPDFSLTTPQTLLLPVGGKAQLNVTAVRKAGFKGAIQLRVEGLPEGATVADELMIPEGKNALKVAFEASESSGSSAALIRIVGTATIGDTDVERTAQAAGAGNLYPRDPSENQLSSVLLARTMKAPIAVQLVDKNRQRAVHRGTTYPAPFIIQRDDGFDGEVTLMMAATQSRHRQGIFGPIMTVDPGVTETFYPCFMPEWLATDRTTRMVVMGMARVADPAGAERCLMAAADARITMILEGALLKVSHQARELTVVPGNSFEIPVDILRAAKLAESVRVEITVPQQLREVLSADSIEMPLERTTTTIQVKTTPSPKLTGDWTIQVRATAIQDGRWPVVSVVDVPVRFSR